MSRDNPDARCELPFHRRTVNTVELSSTRYRATTP